MIWGLNTFNVNFSLNQMLCIECVSKLFNLNLKMVPVEADFAISADKSESWKSYHVRPQLSPEPSHPTLGINCPLPADWEPSHCWWEIQLISPEFILATAGAQYDVWRGTALLQKSIIPPSHTSEPCLALYSNRGSMDTELELTLPRPTPPRPIPACVRST